MSIFSDLIQIRDSFIREWLQKKQAEYLDMRERRSYRKIIRSLIMEKETSKYRTETKIDPRNIQTATAFLTLREKMLKKEISLEQVSVDTLISQGFIEKQAVKIINKLQEEKVI